MSAHTPGPWRISADQRHNGLVHHIEFDGTPDHSACHIATLSAEDEHGYAVRMNDANARLIAAAPALAAALARVTDALEAAIIAAQGSPMHGTLARAAVGLDDARAALAEAGVKS